MFCRMYAMPLKIGLLGDMPDGGIRFSHAPLNLQIGLVIYDHMLPFLAEGMGLVCAHEPFIGLIQLTFSVQQGL